MVVIFISCDAKESVNSECENVVCTFEYRAISITIINQSQIPVALDSFKVIDKETGVDYSILLSTNQFILAQETGRYPLVNDASFGLNEEYTLQFKGYINNTEVVSSTYEVSTDCCHINLISGDLQLELN